MMLAMEAERVGGGEELSLNIPQVFASPPPPPGFSVGFQLFWPYLPNDSLNLTKAKG